MVWPPAVADFQAYFPREFIYGSTLDTVTDADITRALNEAALVFNTGLWASVGDQAVAYLYVSAHFLALNIQGAGGLSATPLGRGASSGGGGAIESKSVGGVSVSYAIPDIIRQNPLLAQFWQTNYGQKYLALLMPRLVGNVMIVSGNPDVTTLDTAACEGVVGYGGARIPALIINTILMPAGVHAVAYSQAIQATGGIAPLVWTVTNGTLPTGITLSSAGLLSGTPTTPGTYFFTVTVTDARGAAATQGYQVVIS